MTRHFLTLSDLSAIEASLLLDRAVELKRGCPSQLLSGKVLAMIFEKSSTRTRLSFEIGMQQLGGQAIFLSESDLQIGRGESLEDTIRVLSRMVDAVMLRTRDHQRLLQMAAQSTVPIINGLSNLSHPCQLLADIMTYQEHRGSICGKKVAWLGDGNNMCNSYIQAAQLFGFNLFIACPDGYEPKIDPLNTENSRVTLARDPKEAVKGADLLVTDVWVSMGQEKEAKERMRQFRAYQVNDALMKRANKDALFMHCLPAHRGLEVTASVIDGSRSAVWDEAENRLHAQKALLEFLLK